MPRKLRELLQELQQNGCTIDKSKGKGSHRKVTHGSVDRTLIVSGKDGADALPYQEKAQKKFLQDIQ